MLLVGDVDFGSDSLPVAREGLEVHQGGTEYGHIAGGQTKVRDSLGVALLGRHDCCWYGSWHEVNLDSVTGCTPVGTWGGRGCEQEGRSFERGISLCSGTFSSFTACLFFQKHADPRMEKSLLLNTWLAVQ